MDGVRWASKRELRRWRYLYHLFTQGVIRELRRQVRFPLIVNGVKVCDYVADFTYRDGRELVVEDAKGFKTDVYKLKRKLMAACYGIEIREV